MNRYRARKAAAIRRGFNYLITMSEAYRIFQQRQLMRTRDEALCRGWMFIET
jgi:hypothetical protein